MGFKDLIMETGRLVMEIRNLGHIPLFRPETILSLDEKGLKQGLIHLNNQYRAVSSMHEKKVWFASRRICLLYIQMSKEGVDPMVEKDFAMKAIEDKDLRQVDEICAMLTWQLKNERGKSYDGDM